MYGQRCLSSEVTYRKGKKPKKKKHKEEGIGMDHKNSPVSFKFYFL
jgi:hypothetical protein